MWSTAVVLSEKRIRFRLMLSSMFASASAAVTNLICFNISETTRASNFKIYHNVAHDGLYISAGNNVTIVFRSTANRTKVSILSHVWVALSR